MINKGGGASDVHLDDYVFLGGGCLGGDIRGGSILAGQGPCGSVFQGRKGSIFLGGGVFLGGGH